MLQRIIAALRSLKEATRIGFERDCSHLSETVLPFDALGPSCVHLAGIASLPPEGITVPTILKPIELRDSQSRLSEVPRYIPRRVYL